MSRFNRTRKILQERALQQKRIARLRILEKEWPHMRAYRERGDTDRYVIVNYLKCTVYIVDWEELHCTCSDAHFSRDTETHVHCKHLLYVAFVLGKQNDTSQALTTKRRKR